MEKKYEHQKIEKEINFFWEKEKIYKFNPTKRGIVFAIDTPPPTISGKMHIGHAFSYAQQDFIVRYYRMNGKNVFYPFGTDDNGLPTEKLVEKENNVKIFGMQRKDFVKLCQKTLEKKRPEFIQGWKDIGMSCDFNLCYSTISKKVQKLSQQYFIDLYNKKRVYRKEFPNLWCPQCKTAIAQADMEDNEIESVFNNIRFKLENDEDIVIATTRPELLSSCVAIFVNPNDRRYKKIIGKKVIVPIFNQKIKIYSDKKVNPEKGTGIVMCCTFGDVTDIQWYTDFNLPLKISINKDGTMNENAGIYKGLKIKEARKKIIDDLLEKNIIIKKTPIKHNVNIHERCGTEIEILNTTQWFVKYLDLKKEFLKRGNQMNWFPSYMQKRYENWVKGLRWDWCISRQRYFGIPFPVWYCKKCQKIILAKAKELPVDPTNTKPKEKCSCGSEEFIAEKDVLDTWATSSLTPQISIDLVRDKKLKERLFPMFLRPQAHDIINFWLFYTVVRSKIHFNEIPWKNIMISGFVLDSKGEKMSKSKGNVVSPQEVIKKYGADVLRHWSAKASPGEDLRWNEEEVKSSKRTTIKIWNASRFCFLHIKKFDNKKFNLEKIESEDKWILNILQETIKNYHKYFRKYEFKKAREKIDYFFWRKFCDYYLEIIKPRLYGKNYSKISKEASMFTLYNCLLSILKLYAPFMPFITEKIFREYFKNKENEKSIHKSLIPKIDPRLLNPKIDKEFNLIINIIAQIRKYKSEKNISFKKEIGALYVFSKDKKIEKYFDFLKILMNIKKIEFRKSLGKNSIKIDANLKIKISS